MPQPGCRDRPRHLAAQWKTVRNWRHGQHRNLRPGPAGHLGLDGGPEAQGQVEPHELSDGRPGGTAPQRQGAASGQPGPSMQVPGPTTFFVYNPSTNKAAVIAPPKDPSMPAFAGRFLL